MSSRNVYLSVEERAFADTLYRALRAAEEQWDRGATKAQCLASALDVVKQRGVEAAMQGIEMRPDYIEMNDSDTFEVLDGAVAKSPEGATSSPVILSGAVWIGQTKLIDNIILGDLSGQVFSC